MDFNTGNAGDPPPPPPPGGSSRAAAGGAGKEFNLSDPVQSFIGAVRALVTGPVGFFTNMARQGNFLNPLVFALICAEISAIIGGLLAILGSVVGIGDPDVGGALGGFVASLILTPIIGAIFLFIWAAILHVLVLLIVRPVNSGFEATFRVASYSTMPALISWIPIVGGIISGVWSIVLNILGIREAHSTTTGRAVLVVLIPVAVLLLLLLILVAIIGAFIFTLLNQ